jgi:hypothetical protein
MISNVQGDPLTPHVWCLTQRCRLL